MYYIQCHSKNLFSEGRGKAVTTRYNALQEVTKNRHVYYTQCHSKNLFSEGRGKAVITRYNKLQCVTRCYKTKAVQGLV